MADPSERTIPVLGTRPRGGGVSEGEGADEAGLLTAGELLDGHYEIVAPLGSGGMAQVYLAVDRWLRREVAIKVTITDLAAHLEREAQVLAGFHHPGLVGVYAYGRHKQLPYVVLEYLRGTSLTQLLHERALRQLEACSIDGALRLAVGVCDALVPLHERGVVHCDLKPGNIMCSGDRVVLIDFGLVWDTRNPLGAPYSGSPPFMAPEIIDGSVRPALATRIDIYALGMILYALIAGAPPFDDPDPRAIMGRQLREVAAPLASRREHLPPQLSSLVASLIQRDPSERPSDVASVRDALLGIPRRDADKRLTE